mgnify:FL=1
MSGTSMATPCVTGAMALLLEKDPTLTPASICQALESSAVQLTSNKSNVTGSGRIDIMNAIKFLDEKGPALPLIKSCSPTEIKTGKNIMITVTLENQGTAPNKNDFILTLTSDDEYITIENKTANFGIINPGFTSKATFTIRAKNTTPDQHIINFRLSGEDISTVLNCRTYNLNEGEEEWISLDDFTSVNYQSTSENVWDTLFSISVSNGCDAPKNLKADIINQNSIKLSWSKSSTAKKYELYRNDEKITETTNTSYTDKDINVNTDYCYIVKSVCNLGLSDPSNEACTSILEEDNTDDINEIVSSFNLYPNPVEDELHLEADGIIEEVIIYNINGQQTIINSIQTSSTHSVINVSNLNPGIYFIKINETMNKFIKK